MHLFLLALILEIAFCTIYPILKYPNSKNSKMLLHESFPSHPSIMTPILQNLHWLPVKQRIGFKILLLVFHCLRGTAPQYNISLLHYYTPTRSLRSSNLGLLQIPNSKKLWGERAFAYAGPSLWNSLPQGLRDLTSSDSFKSNLKTYLFKTMP